MKKVYIYFLLVFLLLFNYTKVFALDEKLIKKLENYLNNFNNISSTFIQSSSDGFQETGKILLSKPGKLRIEYKKKNKLLIIADGEWLHYYDIDINEIQSVVIEKSPAWILFNKFIYLKKDFHIQKLENKKGKITLTIKDKNIENIKSINLIFSSNPIKLKKLIISDDQDIDTTVSLLKIKRNIKFDSKVFKLIK